MSGIFGDSFPAMWEDGKTQSRTATSVVTVVGGASSNIGFANIHDYEVGMFCRCIIVTSTTTFSEFAYVTAKSDYFITVDVDILQGSTFSSGAVIGYIAFERTLFESTSYIDKDELRRKSITGKWWTTVKGSYSNFVFRLNTLMMDVRDSTGTNRKNLCRLLASKDGGQFTFWPHVDNNRILRDSSGDPVLCDFSIDFGQLTPNDSRDLATYTIRSINYTSIGQNIN